MKSTSQNFRFKTGVAVALILIVIMSNSCKHQPQKDSSLSAEAIFPKGTKGSDKFFTGNTYNYELVSAEAPYTTLVGNVYFEPGARSHWHTHPAGQILIITEGVGYHQIEGQPIQVLHKGDVVKCPPHVKHWHGASPDVGLQQLYIVPNTEKGIVEWLEPVTEEEYTNLEK